MKESFFIAKGEVEEGARLVISPDIDADTLEEQGYSFGRWLLEHGSTPFLKGLEQAMDEAEIRKKVGLGY